LLPRLVFTI